MWYRRGFVNGLLLQKIIIMHFGVYKKVYICCNRVVEKFVDDVYLVIRKTAHARAVPGA